MSVLYLEVRDEKENNLELKDLTELGLQQIISDCKNLIRDCENELTKRS